MSGNDFLGISSRSKLYNRRERRIIVRNKVIKMLAVMESQSSSKDPNDSSPQHTQEFMQTGRTGRRNALPDILSEHARVTSSDLSTKMQSLSTTDPGGTTSSKPAEGDDKPTPGPSTSS